MKFCKALLGLFLLMLLALPVCSEELEAIRIIPVGKLEVLALTDSRGMVATLMPDLADDPNFAPLFKNGFLETVPIVNRSFYLKDGDRKILIDSGWGLEQQEKKGQLHELLKVAGIDPASITDILLTHMDYDHIGGLVKDGKAAFPNATLWISEPEFDAWLNGKILKRPANKVKMAHDMAAIYKDRIRLFKFDSEILPGITALDASGHTPGLAAYEIASGPDKLVIAGDFMHVAEIQMKDPAISTPYDMDMKKAAETRLRLLKRAAKDQSVWTGMHIDKIGKVTELPEGGFEMRETQ